jgi:hypothetical protein
MAARLLNPFLLSASALLAQCAARRWRLFANLWKYTAFVWYFLMRPASLAAAGVMLTPQFGVASDVPEIKRGATHVEKHGARIARSSVN